MSTEELRKKKKEYIDSKRNVPCADCGQSFPIVCMDFHHLDETTKNPQLVKKRTKSLKEYMCRYSYANIDAELNKCVVLCANCHRVRHVL